MMASKAPDDSLVDKTVREIPLSVPEEIRHLETKDSCNIHFFVEVVEKDGKVHAAESWHASDVGEILARMGDRRRSILGVRYVKIHYGKLDYKHLSECIVLNERDVRAAVRSFERK
jgi:hypothetical protein